MLEAGFSITHGTPRRERASNSLAPHLACLLPSRTFRRSLGERLGRPSRWLRSRIGAGRPFLPERFRRARDQDVQTRPSQHRARHLWAAAEGRHWETSLCRQPTNSESLISQLRVKKPTLLQARLMPREPAMSSATTQPGRGLLGERTRPPRGPQSPQAENWQALLTLGWPRRRPCPGRETPSARTSACRTPWRQRPSRSGAGALPLASRIC